MKKDIANFLLRQPSDSRLLLLFLIFFVTLTLFAKDKFFVIERTTLAKDKKVR